MKRNIYILLYLIIVTLAALLFSCEAEIDDRGTENKGFAFFTTKVRNWGVEGNSLEIDTCSNKIHHSQQYIPIEGESRVFLEEIAGDDFGDIKTLKQQVCPSTRGIIQDEVSHSDAFKIAAYYDENGTERTLLDKKNVVFDHTDTENGIDYWRLANDETAYWKLGSQAISTYAWWPTDLSFNATDKTFSYEVGTDPINQKDFLYSYVKPTYYTVQESADLTFKHALTAVQFVMGQGFGNQAGTGPGRVTKIELQNLFYKGVFNPITETWDVDKTATRTFTLNMANPVDMTEYQQNVILNPDTYTFLMLPQDLSESPCLAIFTMEDGRIFRATLNHGGIWGTGQTVRYKLSGEISNGFVIFASSNEATYTGSGGSLSVTSYQLVGTDPRPQKWKVTGFSIDQGQTWNSPEATTWTGKNVSSLTPWITNRNISGISTSSTGTDAVTTSVSISKSVITSTSGKGDDINKKLQSTNWGTRDLSKYNGRGVSITQQSANCYVVGGYGNFSFPAAYGSALRDGSAYANAYQPTINSAKVTNYVNYKGNAITKPYVQDDTGVTPSTVKVIWQEVPVVGAITNLSYNSSTKYISFTVPQNKIYQGNAVIGIFDSNGTCMWSWHIWFSRAFIDYSNVTVGSYTFAPDNLGIVYLGRHSVYGNRSVMLRIQQVDDEGNVVRASSSCKVYVSQGIGEEDNKGMDCVFYQFGRKDPRPCIYNWQLPSAKNTSAHWPSGYAETIPGYSPSWTTAGSQISMEDAIRHPEIWKRRSEVYPSYDWCSTTQHNWWNPYSVKGYEKTDVTSVTSWIKTVYDPCPAGFHIPTSASFAGLTHDISTYTSDHGLTCRDYKISSSVTYRAWAFGYASRGGGSSMGYWSQYGYYHQSISYNVHHGQIFYMTNVGTNQYTAMDRSHGSNVRPLAD